MANLRKMILISLKEYLIKNDDPYKLKLSIQYGKGQYDHISYVCK